MIGGIASLGASLLGGGGGGGGLPGIGSLGGQPGISTSGPAIAEGDVITIGGGGMFGGFSTLSRREPLAAAGVMIAVVLAVAVVAKAVLGKGR